MNNCSLSVGQRFNPKLLYEIFEYWFGAIDLISRQREYAVRIFRINWDQVFLNIEEEIPLIAIVIELTTIFQILNQDIANLGVYFKVPSHISFGAFLTCLEDFFGD